MTTLKTVSTRAVLRVTSLGTLAVSLAGACSTEPARSPHNLELRTAPLNLEGIDFACYDILVENGVGDPVVALGDPTTDLLSTTPDTKAICSTQYGNGDGGAITYIAPCDASEPAHSVTLWVDGLYTGTPANPTAVPFQDPCPNGCVLPATCAPNADTPVEFNLTIMRPANQGFFDIAVNFDNIFCSAKVDCEYSDNRPIELLFDPATGERGQTAVLALACTHGPATAASDPNDTVLFLEPIVVRCGEVETVLDPTLGGGNAYTELNPDPDLDDAVWQYASYFGDESLLCDGLPCRKRYWNVAIGFDPEAADCVVSTRATASSEAAMPAHTTPAKSTYPVIDVSVTLTGPDGGLACSQHPLNGSPTGVSTGYTDVDEPVSFCHRFEGTTFDSDVEGPCVQLTQVSAGNHHSCAIGSDGGLYCWGDNVYGQLGDGTFENRAAPVRVGSASDWSEVSAGAFHTCGLRGGDVYCWGYNQSGQLADGTATNRASPVRVGTASDWIEVSAGGYHTCGRRAAPNAYGTLWCWGLNSNGQIGIGAASAQSGVVQIGGDSDWSQVTGGDSYTCGRRFGAMYCWGYNGDGQLGDGSTTQQPSPVQVGADGDWDLVSAGTSHTCGLRGGRTFCWGGNVNGQLGGGTNTPSLTPAQVGSGADWTWVDTGRNHTCGLADGALWCWGANVSGQLGDGTTTPSSSPTRVGDGASWDTVVGGIDHTCGVSSGNTACWGNGINGQVGNGDTLSKASPTPVEPATGSHCCSVDPEIARRLSYYVPTALSSSETCGASVNWDATQAPRGPELGPTAPDLVMTPITWTSTVGSGINEVPYVQTSVGFQSERQQYGYAPSFSPGPVSWAPNGRPLIRDRNLGLQVYQDDGSWRTVSLLDAAKESLARQGIDWRASTTGQFVGSPMFASGPGTEERVVFDRDCDAYTVIDASRSTFGGIAPGQPDRTGTAILMHSRDGGHSWAAYPLPRDDWDRDGGVRMEIPTSMNVALEAPPVMLLHQRYYVAPTANDPVGSLNDMAMVVADKGADGTLSLSSQMISTNTTCCVGHSGYENPVVARGDLIHVAYAGDTTMVSPANYDNGSLPALRLANRIGMPQYVTTFSRSQRQIVTPPVLVGIGFGSPSAAAAFPGVDDHNQPTAAVDSAGYIHVLIGGHGGSLDYVRSTRPGRADLWSPLEYIGMAGDYQDAYSYPSLMIDGNDRPVVLARAENLGYRFKLVYMTTNGSGDWLPEQILLHPGRVFYGVWYHKLSMDPTGRVFASYSYTPGNLFADEAADFAAVWGLTLTRSDPACPEWNLRDNQTDGRPYCEYSGYGDVSPGVLMRSLDGSGFELVTTDTFSKFAP